MARWMLPRVSCAEIQEEEEEEEDEVITNMAATGEWELVVKNSKKGKNVSVPNGKLTKDEKKEFIQKAPRMTELGGIDTTPLGKENRKPKSPKANDEAKKVEKKQSSTPHQPRSLEEAVNRLSAGEIQSLLDVVMSRFKDSPLIWLKDLASYLNVRVNPSRQPEPTFRGQIPSYPASLLSNKVKKLLLSTLSHCSDSVLASFHNHCITSMVQEQIKGLSVYGYKLILQILAFHRPHVGIENLQSYCELRTSVQNQTPTCLSLLWAVGQSGIDDFAVGLKIWMQLMVPLIGLKNYSIYVVEYGSSIFSGGGGTQENANVLGVREFFSILDFTWCSSGSLVKSVQRQLFALYPKVKTTAFGPNPELVLRNFFPSFLRRLSPDASSAMKTELRTCLVQCLTQDLHCWSIWSQLYLKHLPQSALLLRHLGSEVDIISHSLRKTKEVQATLNGFAENNGQMALKSDSVVGLGDATEATDKLLNQLKKVKSRNNSSFSMVWSTLMMILVMGVLWDIKSSGSFYSSKLGVALERAGLIPYLETLGRSLRLVTIQAYRWSIVNIPFYYSKGCDLAEPYLLLVWSRLEQPMAYIKALVESFVLYIPVMKENIESSLPGLTSAICYYGSIAIQGLQTAGSAVQEIAAPYAYRVHHFISNQVFVGPLAPEKLQEYVLVTWKSIAKCLWEVHHSLLGDMNAERVPLKPS